MDYYGLLFLYYLKGLSGKSVLRLFFNIEAGGTEQLLPENTSAPTTTPILADIQYPDGLRTDQYFTYRETPTTVSNKARIKTIKGNTLVWNQLVHGEFGSNYTDYWSVYSGTGSVSNGELTVTDAIGRGGVRLTNSALLPLVANHKYFISLQYKSTVDLETHFVISSIILPLSSSYKTYTSIETHAGYDVTRSIDLFPTTRGETGTFSIKNVMCLDLTQMFGLGNEPTTVEEFTSLFSLPYYSYNQGSLLSFNGNGIKTVGKNLLEPFGGFNRNGVIGTVNANGEIVLEGSATTSFNILKRVYLRKGSYKISGCYGVDGFYTQSLMSQNNRFFIDSGEVIFDDISGGRQFEITADGTYDVRIVFSNSNGYTFNGEIIQPMIRFAETDEAFEPYTSSTLSLPISTYFPNGMKSAGSVYDELTESKAITRIGSLKGSDIQGTVSSVVSSGGFHYVEVTGLGSKASGQGISNMLPIKNDDAWSSTVPCIQIRSTEGSIRIYGAFITFQEFQTQYASLVLYYELATPTETPITTEDANEALSLLMGKSVSSNNANQLINIITKGE